MTRASLASALAAAFLVFPASSRADTWPDLSKTHGKNGGGENDAAVVVAVEDYVDVPDIAGARENAEDWFLWFTESRRTPVENVLLLRDREGTREGILAAAAEAAGRVRDTGTLWFVFIGHGAPSKDGSDGLLLGWDTQQTPLSVYARGVLQSELLDALAGGEQGHTVVLLDACFSGRSASGDALVEGLQPLVPSYAVESKEATLLTAARADQFAGQLPGLERPAFSYLALGALRGWADEDLDGGVTAREVIAYTRKALVVVQRDREQTPKGFGPGSERHLATGSEEGPDLAAITLSHGEEHWGDVVVSGASDTTPETPDDREHADPEADVRGDTRLDRMMGAHEQHERVSELAKEDFRRLWKIPSSSKRETALEAFVERYAMPEAGDVDAMYAVEPAQVAHARRLLRNYDRKAFVGIHLVGTVGGIYAETQDQQHGGGNAVFVLGFPFARRDKGSFLIQMGGGGQSKNSRSDENWFEQSDGDIVEKYWNASLEGIVGLAQFFHSSDRRGNRVGLWLGETLNIETQPSGSHLWFEADVQIGFACHGIRGLFIAGGGHVLFGLSSKVAHVVPAGMLRIGLMEFLP